MMAATGERTQKFQLRGKSYRQKEPLTERIKGILAEFPKGSQILREILQNADDARSTEQVFLLDHKTYSSTDLIDPTLADYQGPALLAKNNSTFTERDFNSLENLGYSLKLADLDKAGRCGVGFNAVYHMTDVPMILSGDQFIILDPHERVDLGMNSGGERYNFLGNEFQKVFPTSQFEPFEVLVEDFEHAFEGTIFRYPLRMRKHAELSEISKDPCPVEDVLEMFEKFQAEAAEGLLFFEYLEKVSFYELLDGTDKPQLLYKIEFLNTEEIREQRQLLAKNIESIIASIDNSADKEILQPVVEEAHRSLSSSYIAEVRCFSHISNDYKTSQWLIQNHLEDLLKTEKYFLETHNILLKDDKLIPWVRVAACLSTAEQHGGSLFGFLRLPVSTPFNVLIHGFFATSSILCELPVPCQGQLAHAARMAFKADWNQYLFEHCIPQAWVDMLNALTKCGNPDGKPNLPIENYTFWPMRTDHCDSNPRRKNADRLWGSILDDVVKTIGRGMTPVFQGMTFGSDICNSWISLSDGILEDEGDDFPFLTPLLARCGLPMIPNIPLDIQNALKGNNIPHKRASPYLVREHLRGTAGQWSTILNNDDKIKLLKYVLKDEEYQNLRGLPLILLADANGTYASFGETAQSPIYVASEEEHFLFQKWEPRLMSRSIAPLFETHDFESVTKIINIRCWSLQAGIDCLKRVFSTVKNKSDEVIPWSDFNGYGIDQDWLKRLWAWIDSQPKSSLGLLGELWLIPTNQQSLRKVQSTKPIFWHNPSNNVHPPATIVYLLEKLGCTFILDRFLVEKSSTSRLLEVVVECSNAEVFLQAISTNIPSTLTEDEARLLREYLAKYIPLLPSRSFSLPSLESLKRLPIFPKRENEDSCNTAIFSSPNITWYGLECAKIGRIVICAPNTGLIDVGTQNVKYLAHDVAGLEYLETTEYLSLHVLPLLKFQPLGVMNALIECVIDHLPSLLKKNNNNVLQHLCDLPFITVGTISGASSGKTLPPAEIVDKNSDLKDFFIPSEEVFPIGKYAAKEVMSQLHALGMNKELNCKIIIDRVTYYANNWSQSTEQGQKDIHKAAMDFLRMLDRYYSNVKSNQNTNDVGEMDEVLSSKQWIPTTYIDDGVEKRSLSTANDSRDKNDEDFVSKVMPTLDYSVKPELRRLLGWDRDPPIDAVVQQLWALLRQYTSATSHEIPRNLERVFEYLNEIAKKGKDTSISILRTSLKTKKWIPVDGKLYSPSQVTLSTPSRLDLKPYVMTVPNSIGKYQTLFKSFGVPSVLNTSQLIKILQDVKNGVKDKELTQSDFKLGLDLITVIADNEIETWEQEEGLTTRISDLLKDFRDDALFLEFLQNADDVKAKKFCIVFEPNHPSFEDCQTLISEEMRSWQGPALWLYNDGEYSVADIEGLRKIGIGGKKAADGIRIGKFDLGFLNCYHYTDLPSVVTGSHAIFLDPHKMYLPTRDGINKPASFVTNFVKGNFVDQFRPYTRLFDFDMAKPFKGALFRLPLRTEELARQSNLRNKSYHDLEIRRLLNKFQVEAFRGVLLFLKHVEEIEVYELGTDGKMISLWRVAADGLTDDVRHKRMEAEKKEYTTNFCMNLRLSVNGKRDETERWLISTNLSKPVIDNAQLQSLVEYNGLVAHVGVAGILETSRGDFLEPVKSLFSFLPLPIMTKLPVHLHGCFALASDRRSLLSQPENRRKNYGRSQSCLSIWNQYLLRKQLPKTHLQFLQDLIREGFFGSNKGFLMDQSTLVKHYYNYWPTDIGEGMLYTYYRDFYNIATQSGDVFYTRSNGGQWVSYQEAVFEDETLFSYCGIKQELSKIINNILIERGINVVELPHRIMKSFSMRLQVTPKLVRDTIRHDNKAIVEKMEMNVFIAFFEYLLKDKAFAELDGFTILPLMDMSFGTFRAGQIEYYIADKAAIALFPNLSSSFVDLGKISKSITIALTTATATKALNVKKLDNVDFAKLVSKMLSPEDGGNESNINDDWLRNIWDYLVATTSIDMAAFENMPILPTIGPKGILVSLNRKLPLLYEDGRQSIINAILTKIGTHLVDRRYSKRLSDFVLKFSATNVLKCIRLASTKAKSSIEELLLPLSDGERNTLRTFFQGNYYNLFNPQLERSSEFIEILRQLPIYPAYASSSTVVFKPAKDCYLLPRDLPVFSGWFGMTILCNDHTDPKFAAKIGIPELSLLEHLRDNVLPLLQIPPSVAEYPTFLCKVLSYVEKSPRLCLILLQHRIIPSNEWPNCRLFRASELYDDTHPVFASVFAGAGKFVDSNVKTYSSALRSLGLKAEPTGSTFIECVDEVIRLSNLGSDRPPDYLDRARHVANHFTLNFGSGFTLEPTQLYHLLTLNFIPVNTKAPGALRKFLPFFGTLSSLSKLCLTKHQNVVWTQRPVIDGSVNSPSNYVLQQIRGLSDPPVDVVLDHLHCLAFTVSQKCFGYSDEFRLWLKDTYQFLLDHCGDPASEAKMRKRFLCEPPLFLNGDDPTNCENWKLATHLVIGEEFDINPQMSKVHAFLRPFEKLLELGGAKRVDFSCLEPNTDKAPNQLSHFEVVRLNLVEFYRRHDTVVKGFEDVIFLVGCCRFPASRILLSMASDHFRTMFLPRHAGMKETRHENLPIEIEVLDVSPTAFRIMLDYLYTGELVITPKDIDRDNEFEENNSRRQLQVYLDLLQPANMYALDRLKNLIEWRIINGKMVRVDTVLDIERYADLYCAQELRDFCQQFRKRNKRFIMKAHESLVINLDEEQVNILKGD